MNKKFKRITSFSLGILLLIALAITPVTAADLQNIPSSVNGLPVIFVKTSENTPSLGENKKILVLFDQTSSTGLESIEKYRLFEYFEACPLPENYSLQIYAGKGASIEEFLRMHDKNNEMFKKYGSIQLGGQPVCSERNGTSLRTFYPTYALIADQDTPTEDVDGLHVVIEAPEIGSSQDNYSALLLNGLTNNGFFMQAGQLYYTDGEGYNVWTDDEEGTQVQFFDVDYIEGHDYAYVIAYYGGGEDWIYVCGDTNSSQSDTYIQFNASGTHLARDYSTSVFFENQNTNADWYEGFSNPLSAWSAEDLDYLPYSWSEWDDSEIYIIDTTQGLQNNGILGIISGDLADDGVAYWDLENVLLKGS